MRTKKQVKTPVGGPVMREMQEGREAYGSYFRKINRRIKL